MPVTATPHTSIKKCVVIENQTYKPVQVKDLDGDGQQDTAYVLADERNFFGLAWADARMGTSAGYVRLTASSEEYLEASIHRYRPHSHTSSHRGGRGTVPVRTAVTLSTAAQVK